MGVPVWDREKETPGRGGKALRVRSRDPGEKRNQKRHSSNSMSEKKKHAQKRNRRKSQVFWLLFIGWGKNRGATTKSSKEEKGHLSW